MSSRSRPIRRFAAACAASAAFAAPLARADAPAPPQGVVTLASSASVDVANDVIGVTFATTREGLDAAEVQAQLKSALDAALAEARGVASPGRIEVRTGNFSLVPRYTDKGTVSGWRGTAELVVEGRDMAGIARLSGRIATLTIQRVAYALSRELREASEGEVAARAIARFRAKAADYAKQFGYAGYAIREVNVGTSEPGPGRPIPFQMKSMAASAEALPVEAGNGTVSVTVNGSVQLK